MSTPPLTVGYPAGWDVEIWEKRHARGELPDRWPYGLDQISETPPPAIAHLSNRNWLPRRSPAPRVGVALGWDESSVARLVVSGMYKHVVGGVIWNTDASVNLRDTVTKRLYRRALKRASALWCLSRPQVEALRKLLGETGLSPEVRFLRFGIDEKFYAPAPFPRRPLIVSAGGDRDRDTQTLFAALNEVKAQRPDVDVVIQSSTVSPSPTGITVVPKLSHAALRDLYARASLVAVATRPNMHVSGMTVALEAMSSARPVVITETPGMRDYVDESVGRLTIPGDPRSMAAAILSLLTSETEMRVLGANGRRKVELHHRSTLMASSIRDIIASILK